MEAPLEVTTAVNTSFTVPQCEVPMPTEKFLSRHIGPRPDDIPTMLGALDVSSIDELIDQAVPERILERRQIDLAPAADEVEVLERLKSLAGRNRLLTSLIGLGYYGTNTPPVVLRNVLESPAWYTAYTPYQAEISQGRLEALLNFQTMVSDLTGLEIANASLLDEGTAAAEALAMTPRITHRQGRFIVDSDCHPQTIGVVQTRAEAAGVPVDVIDVAELVEGGGEIASDAVGVLVQYPGTSGRLCDLERIAAAFHAAGAKVVAATDLLASAVL
ncbi:MAG: glycine dehydrogenase (aminomethyl-transferring), partial [Acidimicrobiia bacterium]